MAVAGGAWAWKLGAIPQRYIASPGQVGAVKKELDCTGLSDWDGRGLIIGGPPSVRSSEKWEGDAACRRE